MKKPIKPRLLISLGNPLSIETIAQNLDGVSASSVQNLLEAKLLEHYQRFGHQPYSIVYERKQRGYVVQAGPIIGLIDLGLFELVAQPKFEGLEVGKCLHLAHHCQLNSLVRHTNTLIEEELSNINRLTSVDYFATAFLSTVTDVINNGLLQTISTVEGPDANFRGTLVIDRHIATGSSPLQPYTRRPVSIHDVPVNRTLKAALKLCRLHCTSPQVQSFASAALSHFNDVSENTPGEPFVYEFESTLPRDEYKQALNFAQIILEGFDPLSGSEELFLPSFTLDLDLLFENFIAFELERKLRSELYTVRVQQKYPHPTEPVLVGKLIQPDIVVEDRSGTTFVVLDTKNKYSLLPDQLSPSFSNADLYQIAYYCLVLEAKTAVLVYPGNFSTSTKYPFRGSEGERKYETKRQRALQNIQSNPSTYLRLSFASYPISLYFWRINLQGTMYDTMESVAQLALFLADVIKGKV